LSWLPLKTQLDRVATSARALGRQAHNWLDSRRGQLWERWDQDCPPLPALSRQHRLASIPDSFQRSYDGYDSSRQGVALYAQEGKPDQPYRVELEVANLRPGAARNHLDSVFSLRWPGQTYSVRVDHNRQARHSTRDNRIQLEVNKDLLRQRGWRDGQPLRIEVTTHRENARQVACRLTADTDRAESQPIFRWEGKTIYYAVTDRFMNGDSSNDGQARPSHPQGFHGGDWKGLTARLDYLKDMQVDALWISCPYKNQRDFFGSDGFHGYWPKDFEQPEPSFGNQQDLKELIDQAHQRGIKVILDVVLNHTSYDHAFTQDRPEWFHQYGNIASPFQWDMENGALAGLPDLDQHRPEVQEYLTRVHRDWRDLGFDGFRLDAVRHVPESLLRQFDQDMKQDRPEFFTVGEAFWQDANFVAGYQNRTLDSMFDFPLAYAIREVFAGDPSRTPEVRQRLAHELSQLNDQEADRMLRSGHTQLPMTHLSKIFSQDAFYDNPGRLATLIDNHDMVRFMSDTGGDLRKLELALAFLYAVRGTPCIYYGTEVGMEGFGVENRNDMEWGKNPQLKDRFAQLVELRKSSEALQTGRQIERLASHDTYALSRLRPDEEVVCLFNNADQPRRLRVPLPERGVGVSPPASVPGGEDAGERTFQDMLGGPSLSTRGGFLEVELPPKGYAFYQWLSLT